MATSGSRHNNQLGGGTALPNQQPTSSTLQSTGSKRSSVKSGSRHRGDSPPSPRQRDVPQTPVRLHDPTVPQTVHAAPQHQVARNLNLAGVSTPKDPPRPMRTQRPATADRARTATSSRLDSPGKEARSRAAAGKPDEKKGEKSGEKSKKEDTGIHSLSDAQLAERYSFDKEIGFGNWGSCWLASAKKTLPNVPGQIPIAIKLVHRQKTAPSNARVRALWNEFKVLRSCGKDIHPNIVRFREFVITPSYALVVMDYYRQPMNVALPVSTYSGPHGYFRQLLSGLHWLHSHNVTHNDIKVANILVNTEASKGASEDGRGQPILVDFGFSTIHTPPNFNTRQCVGTPEYLDPARCRGELHDERLSDVWALGVTFFEIATGRTPFEHEDEQFLSKEQLEKYYQRTIAADWVGTWNIPTKLEDLCRKMLKVSAAERITAEDALQHPFFDPLPDVHGDDLNESLMELLESGGRGSRATSQLSAFSQRPPSASSSLYCPDAARSTAAANMSQLSLDESVGSRSSPGLSALGNDSNVSELIKGSAPWEKPGAPQAGAISTPVRPPRRVEATAAPDTVKAKAQEQPQQQPQPLPSHTQLEPSAFEEEGSQPSTTSLHEGDNEAAEPAKAPPQEIQRKRSIHTPIKNALRSAASRIKTPTFAPPASFKSVKAGLTGRHTPPMRTTTMSPTNSPYNGPSHASTAIQTGEELLRRAGLVTNASQTLIIEQHTVGVQYEFLRTYSQPYRPLTANGRETETSSWATRPQQTPVVVAQPREKADTVNLTGRTPTSESDATEREDKATALPSSLMRHSSSYEQIRRHQLPQAQVSHSSAPVAEVISQQLTNIVSMTSSLFQAVEQTRSMLSDLHLAPSNAVAVLDDAVLALATRAQQAQRAQLQVGPKEAQAALLAQGPRTVLRQPPMKDLENRRRSLIPVRLAPASGEATSDSDTAGSPLHGRSIRRAPQLERGSFTGTSGLVLGGGGGGVCPQNSESSMGGDDSLGPAAGRIVAAQLHQLQTTQEAPMPSPTLLSAGPSPTFSYHTPGLMTPQSAQPHLLRPAKSGHFESGNEADGSNFSETEAGSNAPAPSQLEPPPPVPKKTLAAASQGHDQDVANAHWRSSIASPEQLQALAARENTSSGKKLSGVRTSLRKKLSSNRIPTPATTVMAGAPTKFGGSGGAADGTVYGQQQQQQQQQQLQQQRPMSLALLDSRAHSTDNLGRFAAQPHGVTNSALGTVGGKKVHLAANSNDGVASGFSRRVSADEGAKRRPTLLGHGPLSRAKSLHVRDASTIQEDAPTPTAPPPTTNAKSKRSRPTSIIVASEHAASFFGASPDRHGLAQGQQQQQQQQLLQQALHQHHLQFAHDQPQQGQQQQLPYRQVESPQEKTPKPPAAAPPPATPAGRGALWRLLRGVGSRATAVQRTV